MTNFANRALYCSKSARDWHNGKKPKKIVISIIICSITSFIFALIDYGYHERTSALPKINAYLIWFGVVFLGLLALACLFDLTTREIYFSTTDSTSGLKNKEYMKIVAPMYIARTNRTGEIFTLFNLDVSNFKSINDTYGHAIGDKILGKVGEIITSIIREDDAAVRWGDEFYILACSRSKKGSKILRRKLWKKLKKVTYKEGCLEISVRVDLGIARIQRKKSQPPLTINDYNLMYNASDMNMFHAKKINK